MRWRKSIHHAPSGSGSASVKRIFASWKTCSYAEFLIHSDPLARYLRHNTFHNYHLCIIAAFAVANVQTRRGLAAANVRDLDADGFAHAQTTMIHQSQRGAEARFAHRSEESLHFGAAQNNGQDFRFGDPHFLEHRPAADLDAIQ